MRSIHEKIAAELQKTNQTTLEFFTRAWQDTFHKAAKSTIVINDARVYRARSTVPPYVLSYFERRNAKQYHIHTPLVSGENHHNPR